MKQLEQQGQQEQCQIIHISGPQGSGKSTLGEIFKKRYRSSVVVEDLDILRSQIKNKNNMKSIIDQFIKKSCNDNIKAIILVGLSAEKCLGDTKDKTFIEINTKHKFYIDENDVVVLKQRFFRQIEKLASRKEWFFDKWQEDPDEIQDKLLRFVNINSWKKNNKICKKIHMKFGYKMMKQKNIIDEVDKILNDEN